MSNSTTCVHRGCTNHAIFGSRWNVNVSKRHCAIHHENGEIEFNGDMLFTCEYPTCLTVATRAHPVFFENCKRECYCGEHAPSWFVDFDAEQCANNNCFRFCNSKEDTMCIFHKAEYEKEIFTLDELDHCMNLNIAEPNLQIFNASSENSNVFDEWRKIFQVDGLIE